MSSKKQKSSHVVEDDDQVVVSDREDTKKTKSTKIEDEEADPYPGIPTEDNTGKKLDQKTRKVAKTLVR